MLKWWERFPKKFLFEYKKILELQSENHDFIQNIEWIELESGNLSIRGELVVGNKVWKFDLIFPHFYPSECPTVFPIPRGEKWSAHQYGGDGALCLELGPDNWEPTLYTAADLIQSLLKLMLSEYLVEKQKLPYTIIPSRHRSTLGQSLKSTYFRFLDLNAFGHKIKNISGIIKWKGNFIWQEESCTIIPVQMPLNESIADSIPKVLISKNCYVGLCIQLNSNVDNELLNSVVELKDINLLLQKMSSHNITLGETEGYRVEELSEYVPIVLVGGSSCYGVFVMYISNGITKATPVGIIKADFSDLYSRVSVKVSDILKDKHIGIVGLGSVGSKVSVALARTGIEKFVLIDDDIFLPENASRNVLDFFDIGAHKVPQVAKLIKRVTSNPDLILHSLSLGSQTNTAVHEKILDDLRKCDLIIDCTADSKCFLILAMLCSQSKIPLVWIEVFGGGLGGLLVRSVPQEDSCPLCVRRALNLQLEQYPPAPGKIGKNYEIELEGSEPIIAFDSDVSFAASLVSNKVISILTNDPMLYTKEAILIYGLKKEWIFDYPLQFIRIDAKKDDWHCPQCWQDYVDEIVSEEERSIIESIGKEIKKDDKSSNK